MEKSKSRLIIAGMVVVMLISSTIAAVAATKYVTIKAQLREDVKIEYNGRIASLYDANGNVVYPIMYNGTTYIPVRATSSLLGLSVDWDGKNSKVILKSK